MFVSARTVILGFVVASVLLVMPQGVLASTQKPGTAAQVKSLVAGSVKITKLNSVVASEVSKARADNASFTYAIPNNCATATQCVYGDKRGAKSIILFGDSHARMWLGSIIPIATADRLRLIVLGRDGCPVIQITGTDFGGCNAILSADIATINASKPVAVLLADRSSYPGYTSAFWKAGLIATINALRPSKARVAVIGDVQVLLADPVGCLAANPAAVQKCTGQNPNTLVPGQQKAEKSAATTEKDVYVDPTPWLCTTTKCSVVIGNFVAYWNVSHITVSYSKYLSTVMGLAIKSTI
ncbi:MAG TPA: SGNH hydrolase domain-containing protein [Acidimicrobiales bacterium]